jgi:alpha-mannosidase
MTAARRWKLIVVSHTHWDREWYFVFEAFRTRLVGMVDQLLGLLDRDSGYRCFLLDGQTVVLEDYLEVRPDRRVDIERLVRAGRLQVGPWYVLPDEFLVGGESLVRNLLRGLRVARQFGEPMMVGYLPDCFGHIAHLPAVLRGFGIENAVIWRGTDESLERTEFFWRALDGSEVLTFRLVSGYANARALPVERQALLDKLQGIREVLEPSASTPYLLLMNGFDHMPPQAELPAIIATANEALSDAELVHGHLPMLFAGIREAMGEQSGAWPRYRGEFRSARCSPLLPGVLSTRMWIKRRNQECEDLLARWAEPLSVWSALLRKRLDEGWREPPLPAGPPSPYPSQSASTAGLLDSAWRELLCNHPHDSICGCSIDQVHDEMRVRFDRCWQIGEELTRQAMRALCAQMPSGDGLGVAVFNPLNGPRIDFVTVSLHRREDGEPREVADPSGRVIPCQVLPPDGEVSPLGPVDQVAPPPRVNVGFVAPDVPGFGYRTFRVVYGPRQRAVGAEGDSIENEFFRVTANSSDGTLTVFDKKSGRRLSGLNRFVDGGDRGDEYNYCRPEQDELVKGPQRPPRVRIVEAGPARWTLEVFLPYWLPRSLNRGRDERSPAHVSCPIVTRVRLYPGVRRIDIRTVVENRAQDHRLRVHFPAGLQTDVSHAEQHFGVVARPVALPPWDETWAEEPVGTYPQKSFVDVSDGLQGLLVANRGLPEYEVLPGEEGSTVASAKGGSASGGGGDSLRRELAEVSVLSPSKGGVTIALTLLRCVGYLARFDLSSRRGLAGPLLTTPGAQMLGRHTFDYALVPHEGGWEEVWLEAHRFAVPMRARRVQDGSGALPTEGSLLVLEGPAFVVSALKRAEDGQGVVVRLYNVTPGTASGRVRLAGPFQGAEFVNMEEVFLAEAPLENGWVHLEARPNQIINLRFRTGGL